MPWSFGTPIYHCAGGVAFVWLPTEYSFVMKGLDKSCQKCYKVNFVFLRTILSWTVSVTVYIFIIQVSVVCSAEPKLVYALFGRNNNCTLDSCPGQPGENFSSPFNMMQGQLEEAL